MPLPTTANIRISWIVFVINIIYCRGIGRCVPSVAKRLNILLRYLRVGDNNLTSHYELDYIHVSLGF